MLRGKEKLLLLPQIALWKLVKNVRSALVKYDFEGIQLNGMLKICLASMKDATNMKTMGARVKSTTATRRIQTSTSMTVTFPV